ncbi:GTP-binding protein [Crocosphaera sp.]|uniref:GTP-binding protein n=1 Tax=Crocosphaera sp. TaxID=2729996 RepID=UPI00263133A8|nr:GTP-binding protein [Crocosphaera sp.]MDJ0581281.1 GTP-binding protein [Crocosphaera sp.]
MSEASDNNSWNFPDLDEALVNFDEIQEQLNYQQAQDSLRNLVNHLDLTNREQIGLESELKNLTEMLEKLECSLVQIVAFGMVGRGKSSLLNALIGKNIFKTGPLHGVTQTIDAADWKLQEDEQIKGLQTVALSGWGQSQIQLIDTPGIDEVDGESREMLAHDMAKQVDLILFVISGDMTKVEFEALSRLRSVGKPIILIFNKIDQYPEIDRLAIYEKIRDERVKELLSPDEIVMVAAAPLITEISQDEQGNLKQKRSRGKPKIESLKLKILEILHREGKSLVALNTMLYADEVNEQIVARKLQIREKAANQLIYKAVMIKAMAVALNPVTVVDLFTGAVVDVAMILSLSNLYGIAMTQQAAIALLQKIGVSMGGISATEFLTSLGLSSLKGMLGLMVPTTAGLSLLPYVSIAITQGSVAGVSCYAIGQVTKRYLANGAAWGPEGPKTVVKQILLSLDKTSILNRIKWELGAKLKRDQGFKVM